MNQGNGSPAETGAGAQADPVSVAPSEEGPGGGSSTASVVRPLVYLCHEEIARLTADIALAVPMKTPEAPILGQAVLRDLAWLCAYLREVSGETPELKPAQQPLLRRISTKVTALEPVREAVLDFLNDKAPNHASAWLEVQVPDEPLRWAYRVRTPHDFGYNLNRLLRSSIAAENLLDLYQSEPLTLASTIVATMAELELAMCEVPPWKSELHKIHNLATNILTHESSQ